MQPDLLGLEFTKGELKRLTGVNPDGVSRASIWRNKEKRFSYLASEFITIFVPTLVVVGLVYTFVIRTTIGSSILAAIALLLVTFILIAFGRWIWRKKKYPQALKNLLNNIDRYHTLINDVAHLDDDQRSKLVQALHQLREELVQALRIERQRREHQEQRITNTLTSGLSAVITDMSTRNAPIVNTILQISSDVQAQVRKLQN